MQSAVLKKIKQLDKSMRDDFKTFPLFKVTFAKVAEDDLDVVLEWYENILSCDYYRSLRRLWNGNSLECWQKVRAEGFNLPEYDDFNYRKSLFVEHCKKTMPEVIRYIDPRRI